MASSEAGAQWPGPVRPALGIRLGSGASPVIADPTKLRVPAPLVPRHERIAGMRRSRLHDMRVRPVGPIGWQADTAGIHDERPIRQSDDPGHMGMTAQDESRVAGIARALRYFLN